MILKDKTQTGSASIKHDAGIKQEQDVAFYLRRAYKDSDNVMVLNDLRLSYGGETAQIDHLIVYSYGFIVIESKSIRGEVQVNEYSEWSRSYKGQWRGMPSPIKQAELQITLLKKLLQENAPQILGKLLGLQLKFGGRCYDVYCAISSDAIIDRSKAPAEIADNLVKSEFIVEALDKKMALKNSFLSKTLLTDGRASFSKQELANICDFIIASNNKVLGGADTAAPDTTAAGLANASEELAEPSQTYTSTVPELKPEIPSSSKQMNVVKHATCKHCGGGDNLSAQSGRYGYFVQCQKCNGNTPLKQACPHCESGDTRVSKSKQLYVLNCMACSAATEIFRG